MSALPIRSGQQLAEVLVALAAADGEAAALQGGIECIAESFDAEVGALVRQATVVADVGYPHGHAPHADLVEAAQGRRPTLDVPGAGRCHVVVVPVPTEVGSTLVLARSGPGAFDMEEVSLLRGMARVLAIALDVVRLLERERALQEQARTILDAASDAYLAIDPDGKILAWNEQATLLFGWKPEEALGLDVVETIVPPRYRDVFRRRLARVRTTGSDHVLNHRVETSALYRDGRELAVEFAAWVTTHEGGLTINAFVHDISERKAVAERLARQALHDPLTGLPNRELFLDRLDQALRHLTRRDRVVAVLFVDLDRFKQVNDTLGHAAGDRVLLAVTQRIQDVLRIEDTVARLGGDEFTILCPELPADADIGEIAERLLAAICAPVAGGEHDVSVTASVGVAVASGGVDAVELLREADSAMYQAKQLGRNRFEVFDQAMRARTEARLGQSNALRDAVERHELRVLYQPIVDVADEAPHGVEALVRWQHPTLGLIGPGNFIAMAEATGLVIPLGAWVLRQAVAEVAQWNAAGSETPFVVAVNLSARQLTEPGLVPMVASILDGAGLDPAQLCLEITETVFLDDLEVSGHVLRALKGLGVRLAIDDFGTGYSSLAYLRSFDVDLVKIDRSFVAGLGSDATADAIVAAVVNLAHSLGLRVVAEGVETRQQLAALEALGCDQAQGYYWSEPVKADAAREWLERPRPAGLNAAPMDVMALLADRAQVIRARTGRTVILRGPDGLPPAYADRKAVVTVLDHLLARAAFASAPDRPLIVWRSFDRHWVRVSVADFGHGHAVRGRATQAGLDPTLVAARSLVEAMGGRMAVRGGRGPGSVTTFTLPRSAPAAARSRSAGGDPLDLAARSVVGEFMRQLGAERRTA